MTNGAKPSTQLYAPATPCPPVRRQGEGGTMLWIVATISGSVVSVSMIQIPDAEPSASEMFSSGNTEHHTLKSVSSTKALGGIQTSGQIGWPARAENGNTGNPHSLYIGA